MFRFGHCRNATMENMCSKCYREKKQQEASVGAFLSRRFVVASSHAPSSECADVAAPAIATPPVTPHGAAVGLQTDTSRCWKCRRNIGLVGVKCKCDYVFCAKHRHAHMHECVFDYKTTGREELAKSNPLVLTPKLEKI